MIGENVCLSGGADGADLQFGMTAGMLGHSVIHWSFNRHKSSAPKEELVELSEEQLVKADPYLVRANKTVGRRIPINLYVKNLLRRNWYQVQHAERVYAVAPIEHGQVQGGTAWATQMFIDRYDGAPCECYVFDLITEKWFVWKGDWIEIESPPQPFGIWAGIGSRKLSTAGKNAIRTLMGYRGNEPNGD